jgi:3-polyprenyl-4-hydroxybenzoate decarboxylase
MFAGWLSQWDMAGSCGTTGMQLCTNFLNVVQQCANAACFIMRSAKQTAGAPMQKQLMQTPYEAPHRTYNNQQLRLDVAAGSAQYSI